MMKSKEIDFSKFEWDEIPVRGLLLIDSWFYHPVGKRLGFVNIRPPRGWRLNAYRNMSQPEFIKRINKSEVRRDLNKNGLAATAAGIGISDDVSRVILQRHMQRLRSYTWLTALLATLPSLVSYGVFLLAVFYLIKNFQNIDEKIVGFLGYLLIVLLLMCIWILSQILGRIGSAVIDKRYADTFSVIGTLYVMVSLLRKSALELSINRKYLQMRISYLSRHVALMATQFKGETVEGAHSINLHFENMARFVREHEHLVVMPQKDSLEILRRDFYMLLKVLVSGNYGEFSHKFQEDRLANASERNKIAGVILTVIGFAIPAFVIILLYSNPQQISRIGVDVNTVAVIALAWLLLTIDATLKLGIVERITGLAKAIRDLG